MTANKLSKGYNLRWESSRMMLPEHREQLLEEKRKQKEFQLPVLDEDRIQEMNYAMMQSIANEQPVIITYAEKYGPTTFYGWIQKIDAMEKSLKISNDEDHLKLPFQKILQIEPG